MVLSRFSAGRMLVVMSEIVFFVLGMLGNIQTSHVPQRYLIMLDRNEKT